MMDCRDVFERASDFHDGDLSDRDCAAFAQHLGSCSTCSEFYRTFEQTILLARTVLVRTPEDGLPERIVHRHRLRIASGSTTSDPTTGSLGAPLRRPGPTSASSH